MWHLVTDYAVFYFLQHRGVVLKETISGQHAFRTRCRRSHCGNVELLRTWEGETSSTRGLYVRVLTVLSVTVIQDVLLHLAVDIRTHLVRFKKWRIQTICRLAWHNCLWKWALELVVVNHLLSLVEVYFLLLVSI